MWFTPTSIICPGNTVVMYFLKAGPPKIFDSLGHMPAFYKSYFRIILLERDHCYLYNTYRIQPCDTKACGYFCVYFYAPNFEKVGTYWFRLVIHTYLHTYTLTHTHTVKPKPICPPLFQSWVHKKLRPYIIFF